VWDVGVGVEVGVGMRAGVVGCGVIGSHGCQRQQQTKKFWACYLDVLDLSRDELMEPLLQAARLHGTRWEQWGRV
jgi:hypothetical protein